MAADSISSTCPSSLTHDLTQPFGITLLVTLAISAISMGALVGLLVYVRALHRRLQKLSSQFDTNNAVYLEELKKLRKEVTFDDPSDEHDASNSSFSGNYGGGGLRRRPSLGGQSTGSNGGMWIDGYSSSEEVGTEDHVRRTIKRTLSNSSIASVQKALTSGVIESVSKNDLDTLVYMFGDAGEGVGC